MKIVRAWVSGDGFTNYPDPSQGDEEFFARVMRNLDEKPFEPGDIVLTDWRDWHRVIITNAAVTSDGYEYESVPLSSDNGNETSKGWVRVNNYNSILQMGALAPLNYCVYIQVRDKFKFTSKNICRKRCFHPFMGHATSAFMEALESWLDMSDEALMGLNADWS